MGGLTPLDIKINYKGTVIKTGDISIERAKQINGTEKTAKK